MASAHWRTGHTVNSLLQGKETGWNFLQLVRLLIAVEEAANDDSENTETENRLLNYLSRRVKFRASLAADFPPGEIRNVKYWGEQARTEITTVSGAIAASDGPLPEPFIVWLRELEENGDMAMSDFLDIFNNRLLALRYIVNRATRPTLLDTQALDSDSGKLLLALIGRLGEPGLKNSSLALAGLFANCRLSLPVARQLIYFFLGLRLKHMSSFVGGWVSVDKEDHSRLSHSENARLGQSASLGKKVWDQQKAVEFIMGPLCWEQLQTLVPYGKKYPVLEDVLARISDGRCDCKVTFLCPRSEIPQPRLSSSGDGHALGLSSLLAKWSSRADPKEEEQNYAMEKDPLSVSQKGDGSSLSMQEHIEGGIESIKISFWVMTSQWQRRGSYV